MNEPLSGSHCCVQRLEIAAAFQKRLTCVENLFHDDIANITNCVHSVSHLSGASEDAPMEALAYMDLTSLHNNTYPPTPRPDLTSSLSTPTPPPPSEPEIREKHIVPDSGSGGNLVSGLRFESPENVLSDVVSSAKPGNEHGKVSLGMSCCEPQIVRTTREGHFLLASDLVFWMHLCQKTVHKNFKGPLSSCTFCVSKPNMS